MTTHYTITTTNQPGAVGIVQVSGDTDAVVGVLEELTMKRHANSRDLTGPGGAGYDAHKTGTLKNSDSSPPGPVRSRLLGVRKWEVGRLRLCNFADIDEGLAGMISPTTAQLMPHGGPRVMQKLTAWLRAHGVPPAPGPGIYFEPIEGSRETMTRYPEASSPIEADMLHAIAAAASPAAIDRLAAQPALWRQWFSSPQKTSILNQPSLNHLLSPPTVVVVGRPNVGKSTLLNQLLGRSASVVADLPGTTRDWVGGLVELCPQHHEGGADALRNAVAVRWLDTPGIHASKDPVEQRAIELARGLVGGAQVLISMAGADEPWLDASELPRKPDLMLYNDFNSPPLPKPQGELVVNAATGEEIDRLTMQVLKHLGLSQLSMGKGAPWAFSLTLQAWAAGEEIDFAAYLAV